MKATPTAQATLPNALTAVLIAQFLSALADNALLFAAIALIKSQQRPESWIPLLQEFFVVAFILLAPFAGPLADAFAKGRVMLLANSLKLAGGVAMLGGIHPLWAYGLVGVGAAAYSPAKYGILSEMVSADRLVAANGLMEGSTIVAILLGVAAGGWLADIAVPLALWTVLACYAGAMLANLFIPNIPAAHTGERFSPSELLRGFITSSALMLKDRDARFSLGCTSLFWGSGATLRLLLVAWVPLALDIHDTSTPANLNGAVAIGIAGGAALASAWIRLDTVNRALWPGLLIGPVIMMLAPAHDLVLAVVFLVTIGLSGGMFVVPLNALLQERGHHTVGAGHAIAIQNLFENLAMLFMVGLYTFSIDHGVDAAHAAVGFGAIIFIGLTLIGVGRLKLSTRRS
ncbi:lysophospholipid transporter LplT [Methylococcus sp. EFPC2]|uniref:lysophospholipid transporter LplT n=1 Tax=Methylococcus sp. EFPC2 TaxID=2812648 RepID=UPI001966DE15|nr:lysophospholipid transporter LplT [Methylococcus sp. EFPC2]QSA95936.1 lysophospholipid transporter LplT [Methylococcus sp. EFPC2]